MEIRMQVSPIRLINSSAGQWSQEMIIRKGVIGDASRMKELHNRAVMELCHDDYSLDELQIWVNKSPIEKYIWRLERQRIFIAEIDSNMVGFARWYPEEKMFCSICVEPSYARQGIATKLMEFVYQDAEKMQVKDLWLEASLTAVPFYGSLGWEIVSELTIGLLKGLKMIKKL